MSLARQYAAVGQNATAAFEEEDVTHLPTKKIFRAKIVPVADVELNVALGRDAREAVTFHFRDQSVFQVVNDQDLVAAIGAKFRLTKRTNNAASLHLEFGGIQGVPGVDDWA